MRKQALRLHPVGVEVGVRFRPPIELEQVAGEESPESLAVIEFRRTQRNRPAATT